MLIQYQNSKEDYLEANADLATWATQRAKRSPRSRIFAAASGLFTMAWIAAWQSSPFFDVRLFWLNFFIPYCALGIFVFVIGVQPQIRARKWRRILGLSLVTLTSTLIILGALLVVASTSAHSGNVSIGRVSGIQLALTHATWIFMFFGLGVLGLRSRKQREGLVWSGQPSLTRAKTADISATGVCVTDPLSRTEYDWPAFVRSAETKNLFLLYLSNFSFLMLPKRAFPDEEHLEAMRAPTRGIGPAPSAFPVQPITSFRADER